MLVVRGCSIHHPPPLRLVHQKSILERERVSHLKCLYDLGSVSERLAKAEAVSSRLDMVLDVVAANERERLQHAHSLRMLQESNSQFAEQLQQVSTGFVEAMAKLGAAFDAVSASAGAANQVEEGLTSPAMTPANRSTGGPTHSMSGRPHPLAPVDSRSAVDAGTERLLAIREAVRIAQFTRVLAQYTTSLIPLRGFAYNHCYVVRCAAIRCRWQRKVRELVG
eukprot:COSAG03_NODE_838_length_5668_cov_206.838391_4_plen_223_part_00